MVIVWLIDNRFWNQPIEIILVISHDNKIWKRRLLILNPWIFLGIEMFTLLLLYRKKFFKFLLFLIIIQLQVFMPLRIFFGVHEDLFSQILILIINGRLYCWISEIFMWNISWYDNSFLVKWEWEIYSVFVHHLVGFGNKFMLKFLYLN